MAPPCAKHSESVPYPIARPPCACRAARRTPCMRGRACAARHRGRCDRGRRARAVRLPPRFRQANRARIGLDPVLGRIGALEVQARDHPEGHPTGAAPALQGLLRGDVGDSPTCASMLSRRDRDAFDADLRPPARARPRRRQRSRSGPAQPEGRRHLPPAAPGRRRAPLGFYTRASTTSRRCSPPIRDQRFLELGRSCVLEPYRNKRTVELLWHGIWTYVLHHRIDVMFGCASLEGTDPEPPRRCR